ncbi:MAG: hypothetical protein Kow00124_24670 [Anaerolineae bacterium]
MTPLLTILLMGLATFGIRASVMLLLRRGDLPPGLTRALRYVPPTVLSAIIFPELLAPGGTLDLSISNLRLIAGIGAALIAWRTKNTLLTIAAGMALLWALTALFPSIP